MKNKALYLYVLVLGVFLFTSAKSANAVSLNNIQIRETENIKVITTATPTPSTTITIKPIKNITLRTTLKKTNAIKEIDRRINSLNKLTEKINLIKKLTATQKETLLAQIKIEVTKLEELRTKIENETDATALLEEKKSITNSYRIYALFIPKIEIMAHASKIIEIAEVMATKTTDSILLSKISDAKTKAQTAFDLVFPLVPEDFPGNKVTLKTARDLLRVARTGLNDVYPSLKSTK